ncbi:B12-binding domain-containing radical SAM protein [Aeoliella sp. ICT_H6.2]|uniref:B12-binding domain-containing radical SAM protein n=1 Tax=Aeoliella straminimaris TaxID=2954799 RepID=A0A9X2FBS1_9BACT|nr:radical SAM protein [Aeoliella straminimaris]MCO6043429.1 B12-binding domain-containing radical SAM protein [Aeoliella straminimaris]
MHVTLIYPSVGRKAGKPYVRAWQMQPLSMAVLASLMPREVEVTFFDDRMESIDYDAPTDLVVLSVETFTALRAYRIAAAFRARGVPVIMGGYHVTLLPSEASQFADAIVLGDAEPVWTQVLEDARRGTLQPQYDGRGKRVLSDIRPDRSIFGRRRYQNITLVEYARGCNFRCDFCSITSFHKASQSHRPAQDVARDMEESGSRRFFIVDDNIVSDPSKARQLCREITPLGINWVGQASIHIAEDDELLELMAKSGCRGVLIGMESINQDNLAAMGKAWNTARMSYAQSLQQFRKHGLAVYGTFVFGYDQDNWDVIKQSVAFAREHKLFLAAFNHLVPFPGTPLYRRLQEQGKLLGDPWWLNPLGRVGDVVFRPAQLSPTELQEGCLWARRQFYNWRSMFERVRDTQANARNTTMLGVYLGLNLGSHFDIDLRQGLQLGIGTESTVAGNEPIRNQLGLA